MRAACTAGAADYSLTTSPDHRVEIPACSAAYGAVTARAVAFDPRRRPLLSLRCGTNESQCGGAYQPGRASLVH